MNGKELAAGMDALVHRMEGGEATRFYLQLE